MIIHLDIERILRTLRDTRRNRWNHDALDTILNKFKECESKIRGLKVDIVTSYCAYVGVAVIYAKCSHDRKVFEQIRERLIVGLELILWAQRIVVEKKRKDVFVLAEKQIRAYLNDLDASLL